MHIGHDHFFFNLRRGCLVLRSWYSIRLHNSMLRFIKGFVVHLCFRLTTKDLDASLVIRDLLIIWMNWSGWVDLFVMRLEVGILFQLQLLHVYIQMFKILLYLMRKVLLLQGFTLFTWCQLFKRIDYLYRHYFVCLHVMHPLLNLLLLRFLLMLVQLLSFFKFLPQLMQIPLCFFHSLLIPLPLCDSLVTLLLLLLNSHSYLFYK